MDLIPQLIGLITGILGGYSLLIAVRKRYPGVDEFFKRLTGQSDPDNSTDIDTDSAQDVAQAASWQIRRDALYTLVEDDNPAEAIPALIHALDDDDLDVRETAGRLLGEMGKVAVPSLLDILADGDMEARIEATKALGRIGDTTARRPLLAVARDDESIWVRAAALEALGWIGGDVLSVLTDALTDSEIMIQEAAIRGLQQMDTRHTRKILQHYHTR